MQRLKVHALEPGAEGQAPVSRGGEVRWENLPTSGGGTSTGGDYWTKAEIGDIPSADFVAAFEAALDPVDPPP